MRSAPHRSAPAIPEDSRERPRARIIPNLFGIPFGIAGLADVWAAARPVLGTSPAVANALYLLSAVAWLIVLAAYLRQGPWRLAADLRDRTVGPFVSLAVMTPLLVSSDLGGYALGAAQALVAVFLGLTVALGGWLTGQWIAGDYSLDAFHPGYILSTVAGLVGAIAAAAVHLHALAEFSFGIGVLSWLLLGFIFGRLFFRPALPAALVPTLALLIAPPAVAGVAYFFLSHGATGPIGAGLAGYTVLAAMAQLRLIPLYARLRFSVATWTFTFSYAAAATDAILWIAAKSPPGAAAWTAAVTALISLFIAAIAALTVIALGRRQLLPPSTARMPGDPVPGHADSADQADGGSGETAWRKVAAAGGARCRARGQAGGAAPG
jgi:tellurite resistance protein